MTRLLRIYLYTDPSRASYVPLHPDIAVDDMPSVEYGQPVSVGDDRTDRASWPTYVVAHLPHIKQEEAVGHPGQMQIVYEVYVANEADWPAFGVPVELRGR